MIVNPGTRNRPRVRRRRNAGPVRVRRMGPLTTTKRKNAKKKASKTTAKKRGNSMARKKVRRRKVRSSLIGDARHIAAKVRSKASRRAAALKGIRRKASPSKRSNPRRKKRATKRRVSAKRRNPVVRRKKAVRRRRRSNPKGETRKEMVALAKRRGLKATGTIAQIQGRVASQDRRLRGGSKKRKKAGSGVKSARRKRTGLRRKATAMMRSTKVQGARAISRRKVSKRKGKRRTASLQSRRVARTYVAAKRLQAKRLRGTMAPGARNLMRSYGLTRVNPGIKTIFKDMKTLLPLGIAGGAALLGSVWAGAQISNQLGKLQFVKDASAKGGFALTAVNLIPGASTLAVAAAAYMMLRRSNNAKISKFAGPVGIAGAAASVLIMAMTTKTGQKLMAKSGVSLAFCPPAATQGGAVVAPDAPVKGFTTVASYFGGPAWQTLDISPKGASWYGRGDISPLSGYQASDFPVHSPGPGDNKYVMATLGEYGQEGIFADFVDAGPQEEFGSAYPPGGYGGVELEQTPGGTVVSMGEAGIFGGKTAIS